MDDLDDLDDLDKLNKNLEDVAKGISYISVIYAGITTLFGESEAEKRRRKIAERWEIFFGLLILFAVLVGAFFGVHYMGWIGASP